MNKNKLWLDSLTKNYLTTYDKCLACDSFDKQTLYDILKNDSKTWWVLKKMQGQWNVRRMILVNYYMIE